MFVIFLTSLSILAMFEPESCYGSTQNIPPSWLSENENVPEEQVGRVWFSNEVVENAGVRNVRTNQDIRDQAWFSRGMQEETIPEGKHHKSHPSQAQYVLMKILMKILIPGRKKTPDINPIKFKFRL